MFRTVFSIVPKCSTDVFRFVVRAECILRRRQKPLCRRFGWTNGSTRKLFKSPFIRVGRCSGQLDHFSPVTRCPVPRQWWTVRTKRPVRFATTGNNAEIGETQRCDYRVEPVSCKVCARLMSTVGFFRTRNETRCGSLGRAIDARSRSISGRGVRFARDGGSDRRRTFDLRHERTLWAATYTWKFLFYFSPRTKRRRDNETFDAPKKSGHSRVPVDTRPSTVSLTRYEPAGVRRPDDGRNRCPVWRSSSPDTLYATAVATCVRKTIVISVTLAPRTWFTTGGGLVLRGGGVRKETPSPSDTSPPSLRPHCARHPSARPTL